MDYKEEIKKAATKYGCKYYLEDTESHGLMENGFKKGALSKEAKDYWYNEFKRQKIQSDSGQDQSLRNQPLKPSECFHGKSENKMIFGTGGGQTDEENELLQKQVVEPTYLTQSELYKSICPITEEDIESLDKQIDEIKYNQYIKDNPDRPISFNNWKYMVEHYEKPELLSKHDIDDVVNGKRPHYPYGTIQSDPLYGVTNKMFDNVTPGGGHPFTVTMEEDWFKPFDEETIKELLSDLKPQVEKNERPIGIIGHVDHGKTLMVGLGLRESQKGVIIMDMDTPLTPEERFEVMENLKFDLSAIKSIVPIDDVIPEEIISKQEFLKMHDKAVERSITDETYRESRAWDIKKEKKVSHKRNNKRK